MDGASEVKSLKQKSKRQKLDAPDAHLTTGERESILAVADKASRTAIRNRRTHGSKPQDYKNSSLAFEYTNSTSSFQNTHKINDSKKSRNAISDVSPAFLITALEELHRLEEDDRNQQSMEYLEREIEHLRRGIVNRDDTIKKLRAELEEKDRILKSLPRELVVNWAITHRMMAREQVDVDNNFNTP